MPVTDALPNPKVIRVMSFNLFGIERSADRVKQVSELWEKRAALNVETIRRYRPDIIGFQELNDEQAETFRSELTEFHPDSAGAHIGGGEMGNAIWWRAERFEQRGAGSCHVNLPQLPNGNGPYEEQPFACWLLLGDRLNAGSQLLFVNTQLKEGSEGESWRQICTAALIEQIGRAAEGHTAIVTGDFNCNPWSVPYRMFMDAGYVDTYRAAGHGDSVESSTFHGFQGTGYFAAEWGDTVFWRVDWILSRDGDRRVQTTSCTIARDAQPPIYPSDHWPVVTEFLLLPR